MTLATLRVKFEDANGKAVIPHKDIQLPTELSLRRAAPCLAELISKAAIPGAVEALKALGFK